MLYIAVSYHDGPIGITEVTVPYVDVNILVTDENRKSLLKINNLFKTMERRIK